MWNSYWSGRSRREVPQVNYNESSGEEEFDSPLVSPQRPPASRAGSPQPLAIPTLGDNVDEELEAVSQTLRNVGHTHAFRGTCPSTSRPEPEGGNQPLDEVPLVEPEGGNQPQNEVPLAADLEPQEEVEERVKVVAAENNKVQDGNEPDNDGNEDEPENEGNGDAPENEVVIMVNYDQKHEDDKDKAQELARTIRVEFMPNDIKFWFSQLEAEMLLAGTQWLKKTVLQRNLPVKQKEDVKSYLSMPQDEAGNTTVENHRFDQCVLDWTNKCKSRLP